MGRPKCYCSHGGELSGILTNTRSRLDSRLALAPFSIPTRSIMMRASFLMPLSLRQTHWGRFHILLPYFFLGLDLVN
jgi:hypothetical protein